MEINKTIYYDVHFNEDEEDNAVKFIEEMYKKGYDDVAARVEMREDGTKWLAGADYSGSPDYTQVAQVVNVFRLKRNK